MRMTLRNGCMSTLMPSKSFKNFFILSFPDFYFSDWLNPLLRPQDQGELQNKLLASWKRQHTSNKIKRKNLEKRTSLFVSYLSAYRHMMTLPDMYCRSLNIIAHLWNYHRVTVVLVFWTLCSGLADYFASLLGIKSIFNRIISWLLFLLTLFSSSCSFETPSSTEVLHTCLYMCIKAGMGLVVEISWTVPTTDNSNAILVVE